MVRRRRSELGSSSRYDLGALVVVAVSLLTAEARADVESVALRYTASVPCPTEADFVASVRSHTTRWTHVPDGTPSVRAIHVSVSTGPSEASGTLTVMSPNGALAMREIKGPSCMDVTEALAVMVAVAIDPRVGMADAPSAEPPEAKDQGPRPHATGTPPEAAPGQTRPEPPPTRPEPPPRRFRPSPPRDGLHFALDLRGEVTSAVLGDALPGIGASIRLDPGATAKRRGVHLSHPSLAVGVRRSFPDQRKLRGGSVELSWTAGHVRLCPFRVAFEAVAEISPCAEANIGALHAQGRGFAEARGTSTFWLDVGGSVWAAAAVSESVFLSATALVTTPLFRQPFALASGTSVASVPPLGVLGGLGVGLKF